ncbi:unnamed protein product [Brassica oleracea var. botrytis]
MKITLTAFYMDKICKEDLAWDNIYSFCIYFSLQNQ